MYNSYCYVIEKNVYLIITVFTLLMEINPLKSIHTKNKCLHHHHGVIGIICHFFSPTYPAVSFTTLAEMQCLFQNSFTPTVFTSAANVANSLPLFCLLLQLYNSVSHVQQVSSESSLHSWYDLLDKLSIVCWVKLNSWISCTENITFRFRTHTFEKLFEYNEWLLSLQYCNFIRKFIP